MSPKGLNRKSVFDRVVKGQMTLADASRLMNLVNDAGYHCDVLDTLRQGDIFNELAYVTF